MTPLPHILAPRTLSPCEQASELLLTALPDAVVYADTDRVIQKVNPAFTEIFGYAPEEIIGCSTRVLYASFELFNEQGDLRYNRKAAVSPTPYDITYKRKSGEIFPARSLGTTVRDVHGQAVGFMLVLRDVSANEQTASDCVCLAGGVAHDINNLLFPIMGHTKMILEDLPESSPVRESVQEVDKAAGKIRNLVRQLMAFGRKQTPEMGPLNLNAVIRGFEKLLRKTIREDVTMEIRLDNALPLVMADESQVEQILMNLVVNAHYAMPDGGHLTIETGTGSLPGGRPGAGCRMPSSPAAFMRITDTGVGMDDRTRSRIFEPFYTTRSKGRGTGLGLSTVYGIVRRHRGRISVHSEPGSGSTFTVSLPIPEKAGASSLMRCPRPGL